MPLMSILFGALHEHVAPSLDQSIPEENQATKCWRPATAPDLGLVPVDLSLRALMTVNDPIARLCALN
jgi:hypothetical protein